MRTDQRSRRAFGAVTRTSSPCGMALGSQSSRIESVYSGFSVIPKALNAETETVFLRTSRHNPLLQATLSTEQ